MHLEDLEMEVVRACLDGVISRAIDHAHFTSKMRALEGAMDAASTSVQASAVEAERLTIALQEATARASELEARVGSLTKQIGGGNWLEAAGNARRAAASAAASKAAAEAEHSKTAQRLKELNDVVLGAKLMKDGAELLKQLDSESSTRFALLEDELARPTATSASDVGLTDRRVDQLAKHLELQLFGAGAGKIDRTKLLVAALLRRPAVQRLLRNKQDVHEEKLALVAKAMLAKAKHVLKQLRSGRGTRSMGDQERFEIVMAALTPDDAADARMVRSIAELLDVHKKAVARALRRNMTANGDDNNFSRATTVRRARRKDFNARGRLLARTYWHSADVTRFDTNARKKKRQRVAKGKYVEHWRRIQYDTNQQVLDNFYASSEYAEYIASGGPPISEAIFFQEKCWCIVKADHEECACPICTQMYELLRDWHQQRKEWFKTADSVAGRRVCSCGACHEGGEYRGASATTHTLNEFMLCPYKCFPSLKIDAGQHSCEEVRCALAVPSPRPTFSPVSALTVPSSLSP